MAKFAPPPPGWLGAVVLVECAQQALGARDLAVDDAVVDVLGGGDLVVAVAEHQAQQEAAGALGQLAHEVQAIAQQRDLLGTRDDGAGVDGGDAELVFGDAVGLALVFVQAPRLATAVVDSQAMMR